MQVCNSLSKNTDLKESWLHKNTEFRPTFPMQLFIAAEGLHIHKTSTTSSEVLGPYDP